MHGTGRAVRDRAHALTGPASAEGNAASCRWMKTARNIARTSSHDLRKRAREAQLAESITRICAGRAGMGRSKSTLTFEICSTSFERARQLGKVLAKVVVSSLAHHLTCQWTSQQDVRAYP